MNIVSIVTKEELSVRGVEFNVKGQPIFISTWCGIVLKNKDEINGWNLFLKTENKNES